MIPECGCERGGDCTKTTVCALANALQDQAEEFEATLNRLDRQVANLMDGNPDMVDYTVIEESEKRMENYDD
jgi:hypothetical protein